MIDKNIVIGFVIVGVIATAYVLFQSFRTGRAGGVFGIHRAKNPIVFWLYCGCAAWVIIACLQYLYEAFAA